MIKRPIELLAPAKNLEAAIAAVDHGADAVFMGGARFGARRAASNSIEEIARAVEYAHQYGVRLHSTLNTVLFDDELEEAEAQARELIAIGVDALIVQDMAYRRMNLPAELHASTQVGNTTPEGVKFLEECGFARVILERALTLDEIRRIREATNVELECFVHGAICVGHSGRCFLSRSTSHRSGNRGECSQPCRLPYDLVDERGRKILQGKHLLSVRDMDLSESLAELIDAGISSFKIEGRLKDVRYIKNVVNYYRCRLDEVMATRNDVVRASVGRTVAEFEADASKSFTRGASEYMLRGKRGGVASFDTPKAVGEFIGVVESVSRRGFKLDRSHDLAAGDGICMIHRGEIFGTNVNRVDGGIIEPNKIDGIAVGAKLFRNYDHQFSLALDRSRTRRLIDVKARVKLSADSVSLTMCDEEGVTVCVERTAALEPASDAKKMATTVQRQVEKSGGTIFSVLEVEVDGSDYFAPASMFADMRREALEELRAKRVARELSHRIWADNGVARYPYDVVSRYENVTNRLSTEFYRQHGALEIEPALELKSTVGERVMVSSYCLRREIGECLKEKPTLKGELYIEHGTARYRLGFDCRRCQMTLHDCGPKSVK